MKENKYDIIVIGAGSGGLGISLFMARVGLKTLLIDKTDEHIGGDCLNYGCVPSKALIHVSRLMHKAKQAELFGYTISGKPDLNKAIEYVLSKQAIIRRHENADYLRKEGLDVVLGKAYFSSSSAVKVGEEIYTAKKIVLATGTRPAALTVPGIEKVRQFNNETIFALNDMPARMLVAGGGPIGIEIGQALNRLGIQVTIIHSGEVILPHDANEMGSILMEQLKKEGITFHLNAKVKEFTNANEAIIQQKDRTNFKQSFDAVFVAVGRKIVLKDLGLEQVGIQVKYDKIVVNKYLQTTNKHVYTCGDVSGSLMFSHAAEQQARLLLNNFFSPLKKKLNNDYMSWVTFTDPEVATFGLSEKVLLKRNISFEKLTMNFDEDDRAIVDSYQYGKLVLYISKGGLFKKEKILGGSMVAPNAGELVQELILANVKGLSINDIFNKIYPYPVASRVNQMIIVKHKEKQLTGALKKLLKFLFRFV
ncbi:NAD(P)/FAD-dependent oxidoreductase [Ferruginibacter sp.]|uniref:dihydrolipoyl dehydrogenase family protein n=1 Tax=Ferruginibacter sp. TaxID=1940288 RepID=UPI00265AF838|nr:NAD(P)/FAD-dependent oxidoreductase [Ferruginibacter sp.]